jgi:hypothetical protein
MERLNDVPKLFYMSYSVPTIESINIKDLEEKSLQPVSCLDGFNSLNDPTKKRLMLVSWRSNISLDDILTDLNDRPKGDHQINVYSSEDGVYNIVTSMGSDNGTTPFIVTHPESGVPLFSSFGLNPQNLTPEYEWYRPKGKAQENALTSEEMSHVRMGGLLLKKFGEEPKSKVPFSDRVKAMQKNQIKK